MITSSFSVNQCHTLVIGIGMAHGMGRGKLLSFMP